MQLRLVSVCCLVAAVAGSTLQDPFIHESRQDQLAVASSSSGSTLQSPFIHAHREDQLAVATGGPGAKVAAPDTPDRTPAARVPQPSLDDVIVLDGSESESAPEPPRRAVRPGPAAAPAYGGAPAYAGGPAYPPWLRAAGPTVLLLQPIFLPVNVPRGEDGAGEQGPDYYGAADPARLRNQQVSDRQLQDLILRRLYGYN